MHAAVDLAALLHDQTPGDDVPVHHRAGLNFHPFFGGD
jgi:hypothetical protein